jgi:O-antigen ligase
LLLAAGIAVAAIVGMAVVVPAESWQRIRSTGDEIAGRGTLTGRVEIWSAAWEAFAERPLLGAGAGAFPAATASMLSNRRALSAHNILVAVIVEEGLVGLSLCVLLLGGCALTIARLPAPPRAVWAPLMLAWLVGGMSVSWEYRKPTWVLFGLLGAQGAAYAEARRLAPARVHAQLQSFIVEEA